MAAPESESQPEPGPPADAQAGEIASRLNWLRAGVLGANDGIVSTAGIVVGVAGATVGWDALVVSGVAGVIAGALSMGAGEYVSVSSQRDSEKAEIERERQELADDPEHELEQLTTLVQAQGIDRDLAHQVAVQLTARDPLAAHARFELGIDPDELTSPWQAAWASMLSFVLGALIPLAAILLSPVSVQVPITAAAVVISLAVTGSVSARLGRAPRLPATLRNIGGGVIAMTITYGIGLAVGTQL